MNRAGQALRPPSPPGTRVVRNPGAATGFNGLSHADQRKCRHWRLYEYAA